MMRLTAAALSLAFAGVASPADEPFVLLPPSLGRPDRVFVAGRVVKERHDRGPAVVRNARKLASRNVAGEEIEVRFLGSAARATSGHDGEFAVEIVAPEGAPFPAGLQPVEATVRGATSRSRVEVVPGDAPFLVVSDLDDTLVVTNVGSVRGVLDSTFLKDETTQPPVQGMAALLRCLREGPLAPPPIVIVSGTPVQLGERVERFLARNGFPPAALFLRNLGPRTLSGYKEPVLAELRARFPQPLVLVGDSGERDPEIYGAFARAAPGRVLRIYVRRAGVPGPAERFAGMLLFSDPADAARDAAARGLADRACVAREFPERGPGVE
jgi:phosphatidate phosphatase APP1